MKSGTVRSLSHQRAVKLCGRQRSDLMFECNVTFPLSDIQFRPSHRPYSVLVIVAQIKPQQELWWSWETVEKILVSEE